MTSIAIITARGGSKRIPKKNIKEFCGKPIIAYSIEAAIKAGCFDTVMVSTDSEEIAYISKQYGAEVPFLRSSHTSNDYSTTSDVIYEVLDMYANAGRDYDVFCCLYPTAPFITDIKLKHAYDIFIKSDADSLVPVVPFSFPPQRGNIIRNGRLQYQYPSFSQVRSQDLEIIYHDCGQFYMSRTNSFKVKGKIMTDNVIPLILPIEEVQDIDNMSDWALAEMKYKTFILNENG